MFTVRPEIGKDRVGDVLHVSLIAVGTLQSTLSPYELH
jgi:hypothetical protein